VSARLFPRASIDFVSTVDLNLPEEQEMPLMTNSSEALETTMDEGFVRCTRDRRVREIDGIEGIGAVRADLIAECGGWW